MQISDDLLRLREDYAACKECPLHKYRRQSIKGAGNTTDPRVMFILDRFDPRDVSYGYVLQDPNGQRNVLDTILSYLGRRPEDYYYSPIVACPPRYIHTIEDMAPLPKTPEVVKCGERVALEVAYLQPHVVIACGQSAVKSALPKQTPQVLTSAGSMFPMMVPGQYVPYPVPVLITHSLHTLSKLPPDDQPELWHKTCEHISAALQVADRLHDLQLPGVTHG